MNGSIGHRFRPSDVCSLSLVAIAASFPALAHAQTPLMVPPILTNGATEAHAQASASAAVVPAQQAVPSDHTIVATPSTLPPGMPPKVQVLSPSAPLTPKEQRAVSIAAKWASKPVWPHPGPDGVVRFTYGATEPTVVCAALHVCDLELQPGEIVNNINLGDKERWSVTPGISGSGANLTTHMMIKPDDAGLSTDMVVLTTRRTYSIKLKSTQNDWMPRTGFNYPDDMENEWEKYRSTMGWASNATSAPKNIASSDLQFYCITGDNPPWRPKRAYTDGQRTYVEFPETLRYTTAPALVALGNDGGWFSSPSRLVVNYRLMGGNKYVADGVLDRGLLITGVGSGEEKVRLTRGCN